jgi:hypothetical protein
VGCLALAAAAGPAADPPSKTGPAPAPTGQGTDPPRAPGKDEPGKPPPALRLSDLKLPADAILVICEQLKSSQDLVPGMLLLRPEKYQELMDRIEQLQRQLDQLQRKPQPPTVCKLTGQLVRDLVNLTAEFEFETRQPGTLIALGCPQVAATSARLDNHLPILLPPTEEGYVVQVESPGVHHLVLEGRLGVLPEGTDRHIRLGLPRAAITTLELAGLPDAVKKVRVNGAGPQARPADNKYSLGAADRLELAWDEPAPPTVGPPLLEVEGQTTVQVDEVSVTTEANLTLMVRRGQTQQWRLQVPPQAIVRQKKSAGEPEVDIEPADPKEVLRTIKLKEPGAETIHLVVQVRQPRTGKRIAIGPFLVFDTFRQWGNVVVSAPGDVRLVYYRHGDVSQREADETSRDPAIRAAFTYWNLPLPPDPHKLAPAPLELEIEPLQGAVEARVIHTLRLSGPGKPLTVSTRIEITPVRSRVDRLDVQLPPPYEYDPTLGPPPDLVEKVVIDENRVAQIHLVQTRGQPFSVTLNGSYQLPPDAEKASLDLPRLTQVLDRSGGQTPRPLPTLDRGGQLSVTVPEALELSARGPGLEALSRGKDTPRTPAREYTWTAERAPVHADLAWRPHPVEAVLDVFLTPRRAHVHQRLTFQFPEVAPGRVLLRVPPVLAGRGGIKLKGGKLPAEPERKAEVWAVTLDKAETPEQVLILDYTVGLQPDALAGDRAPFTAARRVAIPLVWPDPVVWPDQATQVNTRVRVWCDEAMQPTPAGHGWEPSPWTEVVEEQDTLPILVLRSSQNRKLALWLREATEAAVLVDRALFKVTVGDDGHQKYEAQYRLGKLLSGFLDVELPDAPAGLGLEARLDGKEVQWRPLDGTAVRLDLEPHLLADTEPYLVRKPRLLTLSYQLAGEPLAGGWKLQTRFQPLRLRGDVLYQQVRWQVELPDAWVPLYHGGGYAAPQQWTWRGRLFAPRPKVTDLEGGSDAPSVVCWQTEPDTLRVIHVPTQSWLLCCSLSCVALGLALFLAPLPRKLFWSLLVVLGLAVLAASVLEPTVVSAVAFGCQPGVVVVFLVLGVHWVLQRRYRRQVAFMPGFTRLKSGSSLIRTNNAHRPRGEPSTVDHAPPQGAGAPPPAAPSQG